MTQTPEAGRQAAHVLIDAVTAFDEDLGESPANASAMNLALTRINDVEAVTATLDDKSGAVRVDATDLLGGALMSIHWLADLAARLGKTSREHVLAELREYVDSDQH